MRMTFLSIASLAPSAALAHAAAGEIHAHDIAIFAAVLVGAVALAVSRRPSR